MQDMVVRWLATANALKRLLLLKRFVQEYFNRHDHDFVNQLSPTEWHAVQSILAVIEFGRQVSTMLQTETKSTIALGWIWILLFVNHCKNVKSQPTMNNPDAYEPVLHRNLHPRGKSVAAAMVSDVNKRFHKDTVTSIERMGMMMDPRTKKPPSICGFTPGELHATKKQVSKLMYKLGEGRVDPNRAQAEEPAGANGEMNDPLMDALAALDSEANNDGVNGVAGGQGQNPRSEVHPDLATYLSEPGVSFASPNFDPLKYHQQRKAE
jgi:hypothetical protein